MVKKSRSKRPRAIAKQKKEKNRNADIRKKKMPPRKKKQSEVSKCPTKSRGKAQPKRGKTRGEPPKRRRSGVNWQRRQPGKGKGTARKAAAQFRDIMIAVLLTVLLVLVAGSFFVDLEKVQGYSMSPTLRDSDQVFIRKNQRVQRFDLVLIRRGEKTQICRVIGLPGEAAAYQEDTLYINNEAVDEKFIVDEINEYAKNGGQYTEDFSVYDLIDRPTIPEGKYLLLGDNRPYATDSRHYGLVDENNILGVVTFRLLPLNDFTIF